ncbi:hypothetical protein F2981_24275 (plasmid) [Sinorhizobium meliloti]|nr:hypothetical protein [Sinorhizobium meliloti]
MISRDGTPYLFAIRRRRRARRNLDRRRQCNCNGTLFGAVLLVMIVTTLQIAGLPPGIQIILQGVVIIAFSAGRPGGRMR